MALIGPRIKRYQGTLTTDGAGAATVDLTPGTGYKLIKARGSNDPTAVAPLTGGTIVFRDNSGTGTAVNDTHSTPQTTNEFEKTYNAVTPVTNLRITIAGGGASKKYQYSVWFARTRSH
jgi:hypothetical protein